MVKVMFVCLGNICRSPMAQCIMASLVNARNLDDKIIVSSSATSYEEVGNSIYPPARNKLIEKGVDVLQHRATRITPKDGDEYDLIVAMEERNVTAIERIIGKSDKVHRLLDFTSRPRDIADPWWTDDFETAYKEIAEGCECLLDWIERNYKF